MCADCRVVATELAAEEDVDTGLQVVRVHPDTEVAQVQEIT